MHQMLRFFIALLLKRNTMATCHLLTETKKIDEMIVAVTTDNNRFKKKTQVCRLRKHP